MTDAERATNLVALLERLFLELLDPLEALSIGGNRSEIWEGAKKKAVGHLEEIFALSTEGASSPPANGVSEQVQARIRHLDPAHRTLVQGVVRAFLKGTDLPDDLGTFSTLHVGMKQRRLSPRQPRPQPFRSKWLPGERVQAVGTVVQGPVRVPEARYPEDGFTHALPGEAGTVVFPRWGGAVVSFDRTGTCLFVCDAEIDSEDYEDA